MFYFYFFVVFFLYQTTKKYPAHKDDKMLQGNVLHWNMLIFINTKKEVKRKKNYFADISILYLR